MKKCIYIICLLATFSCYISAQTLDEALELYKAGEYSKAFPVIEKEYNLKNTDASLNQWYGVCLFETGGDLYKAEECISIAAKKNVQDAYYYLGKIYTETYRFDAATKEFDRYAKLKRREKDALAKLEKDQERLLKLKKAASRPEDIQIIDSVVVRKENFLSAYKLSTSSGQIDYYSSMFRANPKVESTIYLNEKRDKVYYAKPTDKKDNIIALYSMEKLLDDFGNEKSLSSDNFGFSGNLNYPFVMSDGVTIYFSAQDKTGFGGYDIYVTRYNMNNDTYLTPERLNMPFNSAFNDYMYVLDEEKGVGWFASDRFQPEGKVCIYTFIPNNKVEILENEDVDYLYKRARISSIRNSWKPGADYSSERTIAQKDVVVEKKIQKDFEFVINDQYTYYTLKDFKNQTAREFYNEFINGTKKLQELNNRLDTLRDSYHSEASNEKAQEILRLEGQAEQLTNEVKEIEIKARNQEINSLKR